MYKIIHWLGVILIASLTLIFVFKPYLLGFTEHPEIRQTKNILMVDREGIPLNDWLHLEKKYGCKFWNNQIRLMSFYKESFEINRNSRRNSEEFLSNYKESRDALERKMEQLSSRTSSDKEILIAELLKPGLKGELRELEKQRLLNIEFVAMYEKMNAKDQEKFNLATSIETSIRLTHASCFDEKSSN
jgi:hypothetical protein